MARPSTLTKEISPPPLSRKKSSVRGFGGSSSIALGETLEGDKHATNPSLASIEAGRTEITDHLRCFIKRLSAVAQPSEGPRLSFVEYEHLYQRNQHADGCHFVVHQHDHPIAGVHYDLRLQFSSTSSISFAIPYGLPGNPNTARPNRMAIETRVHNLWNNLIETASHRTGSLLIWDTGEYEILPWEEQKQPTTDDEMSDAEEQNEFEGLSQSDRLYRAFQNRHIRLRLHGVRLPKNYTLSMRLPRVNDSKHQPSKPKRKRRRADPSQHSNITAMDSSDSESSPNSNGIVEDEQTAMSVAVASEDEEDVAIRANNAYTGATNSIGSIHQRHWFLTLDKRRSGFQKLRNGPCECTWIGEWPAFFVRGREHERSILTGRLADQVMEDEGVEKFIGRKMWRAIME